jgi:hypothetical protein
MISLLLCRMHATPAEFMSQVLETRLNLLPFTFARRFGVAITAAEPGSVPVDVAYRKQPDLRVLAEVRRLPARQSRCAM